MKKEMILFLVIITSLVLLGTTTIIVYLSQNRSVEVPINKTGTAEYLFDLRTPYLGNNSAVSRLLIALDIRNYGHYTFSLETNERPYILMINYTIIEGWGPISEELMLKNSSILLALIENADEIHWLFPESDVFKVTINDLSDELLDIKSYGQSIENFRELLIKLGYTDNPISFRVTNLTNTGLTLIIKNHTDEEYLYGNPFSLYRWENSLWVPVQPTIDYCVFTMIGLTLTAHQVIQRDYMWNHCYGTLISGKYRITKTFTHLLPDWNFGKDYFVSAEFVLN